MYCAEGGVLYCAVPEIVPIFCKSCPSPMILIPKMLCKAGGAEYLCIHYIFSWPPPGIGPGVTTEKEPGAACRQVRPPACGSPCGCPRVPEPWPLGAQGGPEALYPTPERTSNHVTKPSSRKMPIFLTLKTRGSLDLTEYWTLTSAFIFCNCKEVSHARPEQLGTSSTATKPDDLCMYRDVAFALWKQQIKL